MTHQQQPNNVSAYQRKYYLIRKLKADGYKLEKADGFRTILVPLNLVHRAEANSTIKELMIHHRFRYRIVEIEPEAVQAELAFQTQNKKRMLHLRKLAVEITNTAYELIAIFKEKKSIKQQ